MLQVNRTRLGPRLHQRTRPDDDDPGHPANPAASNEAVFGAFDATQPHYTERSEKCTAIEERLCWEVGQTPSLKTNPVSETARAVALEHSCFR
jgi:hypothetical protein